MPAAVKRFKKNPGTRRRAHSRAHRRAHSQPNTGATAPRWIRRRGLHLAGSAAGEVILAGSAPLPQVGAVSPWIRVVVVWIHVVGAGRRRGRPGSAAVWIHVAGSRRGRLDPSPCGSPVPTGHAAPRLREREMREVLRGERGWEREGERDTGHGGALLARSGHDGEVVARATLLDAAPRRGLHTPAARATERWWRARPRLSLRRREAFTRRRGRERGSGRGRERERGSGRGLHAGDGGSACVAGREVGEVGAAPGDER